MNSTILDPIKEKLQKAVELELATIPPYLTAMFSIRPGTNSAAAGIIRSVFMEEMLHMLLAANVLSAIGGKVSLGKKNLPVYPLNLEFKGQKFKDRDFLVHLSAFGPASLDTFLKIELPEYLDSSKPVLFAEKMTIEGLTIGEFYNGIKSELGKLCAQYTEAAVFCGDPKNQINEEYYWRGGGKPIVVKSLKDAQQAIDLIVEQGEGVQVDIGPGKSAMLAGTEVPHYFRFKEIQGKQFYRETDDLLKPPTGDIIEVDYEAVFPILDDPKAKNYQAFEEIAFLNNLFNANYSRMLNQLEQGFNGNPALFYTAILNGMHKLTPLAASLVQMQLPDGSGKHAAPSYEWNLS